MKEKRTESKSSVPAGQSTTDPKSSKGMATASKEATKAAHLTTSSPSSADNSDPVHRNLFISAKGVQKIIKAGKPIVLVNFKAYDTPDVVVPSVL